VPDDPDAYPPTVKGERHLQSCGIFSPLFRRCDCAYANEPGSGHHPDDWTAGINSGKVVE
jgi:hypothetical protein